MKTPEISPSVNGRAFTPNGDAAGSYLPHPSEKGWSVNVSGNVSLILRDMIDGDTPLLVAAVAGVRYPDIVRRILATNTTATGINIYW